MTPSLDPMRTLLERQRVLISDGGMGTLLESMMDEPFDPQLWSAGAVLTCSDVVKRAHRAFLEAGADIITAASYQATVEGFMKKCLSEDEAEAALLRTVSAALEARDEFWADYREQLDANRAHAGLTCSRGKPLVAASIGCYAAFLADGSEYSGKYHLGMEQLMHWHRPRLQALAKAGADLLAVETLPCRDELEAIVRLLCEDGIAQHVSCCWVCMAVKSAEELYSGDSLAECASLINRLDTHHRITAVGINCCAPTHAHAAVSLLHQLCPDRLIVVYPNSGEVYADKGWVEGSGVGPGEFVGMARGWVGAGAKVVGGCCRVGPEVIRALSEALVEEDGV